MGGRLLARRGLAAAAVGLGTAGVATAYLGYSLTHRDTDRPRLLTGRAGDVAEGLVSSAVRAQTAASQWLWPQSTKAHGRGGHSPQCGAAAVRGANYILGRHNDKVKRELMWVYKHSPALGWLLSEALEGGEGARQPWRGGSREAQYALIDLLNDGATASSLLQHPGVVPRLFRHMAALGWQGPLADAILTAVQCEAIQRARREDVAAVLRMLDVGVGSRTRRAAAAMIASWASASSANCGALLELGTAGALAEAAVLSAGRPDGQREVHLEVVRAMGVLARRCPDESPLDYHRWVEPLLFIAADAAAVKDQKLACDAVEVLTDCVNRGDGRVRDAVGRCHLLPLLRVLAARGGDGHTTHAVAASLAAVLPLGRVDELEAEAFEFWTQYLLSALASSPSQQLTTVCAAALQGLSGVAGQEGKCIAQQWLSTLLLNVADHAIDRKAKKPLGSGRRRRPAAERAAVRPQAARQIAVQLMGASRAAVVPHEAPQEHESHMSREALMVYPQMAAAVDAALAEEITSRALQELSALASSNREKLPWLLQAGLLPVLHRLLVEPSWHVPINERSASQRGELDDAADSSLSSTGPAHAEAPLSTLRNVARMLSILTIDSGLHQWIQGTPWVEWLERSAGQDDCVLASNATKALLSLHAADTLHSCSSSLESLTQGLITLRDVQPTAGEPLVLHDGVHLMVPDAEHHRLLAREGTACTSEGAPVMDLLFIHGIRGGAFITWRKLRPVVAQEVLSHDSVWPASWLPPALPDTRILSYEYAAPITNFEGESLPLEDLIESTIAKWLGAGLGHRPLVVVCHSLGGLLLKEVLLRCSSPAASPRDRQLARSVKGVVFFATPHFGSYLADIGWGLRHVGAKPHRVIQHLKPGPHHDELNTTLRRMFDCGQLKVLSFGETVRTPLISIAPRLHQNAAIKMEVVPMESAFPGVGDFMLVPGKDHINICKPAEQSEATYKRTVEFIAAHLRDAGAAAAAAEMPQN